jgi:hypothetical protein
LHQTYKQYKARTSMPSKQCPHSNLPGFINKTRTSLVSPSFIYKKPRPWLPRICCPVPNLSVLLILNKYFQVINVPFLQTKEATPCSLKNPSERCGAPAVSDLVWILLSHNNLVRLCLMAPNRSWVWGQPGWS